eukprot:COSAG03_NODE_617_length_6684_cov_18.382992_2_plen_221_part_00
MRRRWWCVRPVTKRRKKAVSVTEPPRACVRKRHRGTERQTQRHRKRRQSGRAAERQRGRETAGCIDMVDYSKWDNLDLDDSDDEAPPERLKGQPRVTRLDPGTRVTMGPEGITAVAPPQAAGKAPATAKQAALVDAARSAAAAPPAKKQGGALDYSKWDTLEVSDSDDGEEEEEDDGRCRWQAVARNGRACASAGLNSDCRCSAAAGRSACTRNVSCCTA